MSFENILGVPSVQSLRVALYLLFCLSLRLLRSRQF